MNSHANNTVKLQSTRHSFLRFPGLFLKIVLLSLQLFIHIVKLQFHQIKKEELLLIEGTMRFLMSNKGPKGCFSCWACYAPASSCLVELCTLFFFRFQNSPAPFPSRLFEKLSATESVPHKAAKTTVVQIFLNVMKLFAFDYTRKKKYIQHHAKNRKSR